MGKLINHGWDFNELITVFSVYSYFKLDSYNQSQVSSYRK